MTYHELPAWLQKIAYERCEEQHYDADFLIEVRNGNLTDMFDFELTTERLEFWENIHYGFMPTLAEYEARFGKIEK